MEPRIAITDQTGATKTYERLENDATRWQEIDGDTRAPQGEPLSVKELLKRLSDILAAR
jgi:hypothetical protein